jgi:cytochrome c553
MIRRRTAPLPAARRWWRALPATVLLGLGLSLTGVGAAQAQNLERGKEINATCAGCHGEFGQGGKKGEYPRLAGQRAGHIAEQLRAFRSRSRMNLPMFPYTQERELSNEDIADVSAYLASVELPTEWPTFKPDDDALTRLTAMEKVMILPRAPGDIDNGQRIFQQDCGSCHARDGMGRGRIPRLVGQYTGYLRRQMDLFIKGERPHDRDEEVRQGVFDRIKDADLNDVLAYLTAIQTPQGAGATPATR